MQDLMMRGKEGNRGEKDEQIKGEGCPISYILPLSPPTDLHQLPNDLWNRSRNSTNRITVLCETRIIILTAE